MALKGLYRRDFKLKSPSIRAGTGDCCSANNDKTGAFSAALLGCLFGPGILLVSFVVAARVEAGFPLKFVFRSWLVDCRN